MFRYQLVACDRATGAITIPKARALKRYQQNETRKDNFPSLLFPEEYQDEPSYFWPQRFVWASPSCWATRPTPTLSSACLVVAAVVLPPHAASQPAVVSPAVGCEPSCCAAEPVCCDPCCAPKRSCCLLDGLKGLFKGRGGCCAPSCCEPTCGCEPSCCAEPTCCAPEPTCCAEPTCGCEPACCDPCCGPQA